MEAEAKNTIERAIIGSFIGILEMALDLLMTWSYYVRFATGDIM